MSYKIDILQHITQALANIPTITTSGFISSIKGNVIETKGLSKFSSIGSICQLETGTNKELLGEIIGFYSDIAVLLLYSTSQGVKLGTKVTILKNKNQIHPSTEWLGRTINGFGEPIDHKGELPQGDKIYEVCNDPVNPHQRNRVEEKFSTGIKAIDSFTPCCKGQRMGIFAGSGIGKSVLVAMLTKYSAADIKIIGLIGERGREVKEFIEDYLKGEDLKNTILVVSTSDDPPMMKKRAAKITLTLAEYFRDLGKDVLCVLDSVTRFATAQREIGLAIGEAQTSKGYTPSVFSELSKLLERSGPGICKGSITGFFTVLIDGDDFNEPICDAVRGILDGHLLLDRKIGERGRYPAINILRSVSRMVPQCNNAAENSLLSRAKSVLSTYNEMEDMIKIGAYKNGSNQEIDEAIKLYPLIEKFISQSIDEYTPLEESFKMLSDVLKIHETT